jgi:hypothetical protein
MEKRIDLQNFDDDHLRARGKGSLLESKGQEFDRDRYELARVGKKQVLKVSFAFKDGLSGLTALAPVWFGFDDRSFLWCEFCQTSSTLSSVNFSSVFACPANNCVKKVNVHMGNSPCVSLCNQQIFLPDVKVESFRSGSQSKFDRISTKEDLSQQLQRRACWPYLRLHPHLARQLLCLRLYRRAGECRPVVRRAVHLGLSTRASV